MGNVLQCNPPQTRATWCKATARYHTIQHNLDHKYLGFLLRSCNDILKLILFLLNGDILGITFGTGRGGEKQVTPKLYRLAFLYLSWSHTHKVETAMCNTAARENTTHSTSMPWGTAEYIFCCIYFTGCRNVQSMTGLCFWEGKRAGGSLGKAGSFSPVLLRHVFGQVRYGRGQKGKHNCRKQSLDDLQTLSKPIGVACVEPPPLQQDLCGIY